jgi:hypothetical protein
MARSLLLLLLLLRRLQPLEVAKKILVLLFLSEVSEAWENVCSQ